MYASSLTLFKHHSSYPSPETAGVPLSTDALSNLYRVPARPNTQTTPFYVSILPLSHSFKLPSFCNNQCDAGHGQSEGDRAYVERWDDFAEDLLMYAETVLAGGDGVGNPIPSTWAYVVALLSSTRAAPRGQLNGSLFYADVHAQYVMGAMAF